MLGSSAEKAIPSEEEFRQLVSSISDRVRDLGNVSLFTTDTEGLFDVYLSNLPESGRAYHTCDACRRLFERFGGLVTIDERGRTTPALWSGDAPENYRRAHQAVARAVSSASVTGVFLTNEVVWGTPSSPKTDKHGGVGCWFHYHARPEPSSLYVSTTRTASQAMAQKREDRNNVARALDEYSVVLLGKAVKILDSDALYRSEKVLGAAQWLLEVAKSREAAKGKAARDNLLWRNVATAPEGFCHPRSSMIGTLLDDLAVGKSVRECSAAFAAKMHPLRYQRPQADPSAGTVKQAEELFAKLSLGPALERRFARLDEIESFWRPQPTTKTASGERGLFGHLKTKLTPPTGSIELPTATMTWAKFAAKALPQAREIHLLAPSRGNYCPLLTAVHSDAPPILQWDREEQRNPFSLYVWIDGSDASQWGVSGWTRVAALTTRPSQWYREHAHHDTGGIIFVLEGARESRLNGGIALFPEDIRSELHGVRSVIESYSKSASLQGADQASACGLLAESGSWGVRLRVTDFEGDQREYLIDRRD